MNYYQNQRPLFHFTAASGWLNDPNGLVYYDGEYHLFFQHNPFGTTPERHRKMTWGHAVSTDLVHWRQIHHALNPDEKGAIFSGSVVIDWNNTSGFGKKDEPPMTAAYTAAKRPFTQCIAYSNDRGRTWTKYENNPVIDNVTGYADRDPRIFRYGPTAKWILVLYLDNKQDHSKHCFGIFESSNLKDWGMVSCTNDVPFFECPDLFELPVEGTSGLRKWVLHGAEGMYQIGDFDGTRFVPISEPYEMDILGRIEGGSYTSEGVPPWMNSDRNFYAAQTFNDIPKEDGRRIQIAWMRGSHFEGMPFNQQMNFPTELTLRNTIDGIRLFRYPVREIERLWAECSDQPDTGLNGRAFDIDIQLGVTPNTVFTIEGAWNIRYSRSENQLRLYDRIIPLEVMGEMLKFRILLDVASVEIFVDGGRVCATRVIPPNEQDVTLVLKLENGDWSKLSARKLHRIWE